MCACQHAILLPGHPPVCPQSMLSARLPEKMPTGLRVRQPIRHSNFHPVCRSACPPLELMLADLPTLPTSRLLSRQTAFYPSEKPRLQPARSSVGGWVLLVWSSVRGISRQILPSIPSCAKPPPAHPLTCTQDYYYYYYYYYYYI